MPANPTPRHIGITIRLTPAERDEIHDIIMTELVPGQITPHARAALRRACGAE